MNQMTLKSAIFQFAFSGVLAPHRPDAVPVQRTVTQAVGARKPAAA
jgi:hypothetical protein